MWFEVLGPLRVVDEGAERPVAGIRQRIVLSVLLSRANELVSVDQLVDTAWDGAPSAGAAASLRSYMMRLRRSLGPAVAARVAARGSGYSIEVRDGELDAARFEALCRDADAAARRTDWSGAGAAAGQALALWHGAALPDVPCQALHDGWLARLDQLRVQAAEQWIEAQLHLGRHDHVVAQLRDLTARHPLRERFHAQLVLALARGGRQSEALAAYRDARRALVDELGIEPGPELRALHERILSGDAGLLDPADSRPAEPRAAADIGTIRAAAGRQPAPRRLPAAVRHFSGREQEVEQLVALARAAAGDADTAGADTAAADGADADGPGAVCAIDGMAGVGKTALAVHVAHRVADGFPDGQLFIDLHGYTEGVAPRDPGDALENLLRALGVPAKQIPESVDERAALYRERLAGTRTLIVLDNAAGEAQVRPLLPGAAGCLVLVTSRRRLKGLDEVSSLPLEVLPPPAAVALFREVARLDPGRGDSARLVEIAALCGRLPLALRIAAALLRHRPAWSLEYLAGKLREGRADLAGFDDGDRELAAVFALSARALSAPQRALFHLLGEAPGPEVEAYACAALLDVPPREAERLLQSLVDHNLLSEPAAGRYRMHDLLRLYARSPADAEPVDRPAAVERLLDYYQHTAVRAEALIVPYGGPDPGALPAPAHAPDLPGPDAARAWLRAERANLLACLALARERRQARRVIAFGAGVAALLILDGPPGTALDVQLAALAAARELGDRRGEANTLAQLGRARRMTGDMAGAMREHEAALAVYRELGDRRGEATMLTALGPERRVTGDLPGALRDQEEGVRLFRELGDRVGLATALAQLAETRLIACDFAGVLQDCEETLGLFRELGDRLGEANTLYRLGRVRQRTGDPAGAVRDEEAALALYRALEHRHGQAFTLTYLGETRLGTGDLTGATRDLDEALRMYRELGYPIGAGVVLVLSGRARRLGGDLGGAARDLLEARRVFQETGARGNEACALTAYAAVVEDCGDLGRALALYREALELCREVKQPDDEAAALEGLGGCLVRSGATRDGIAHLHQALDVFKRLGMRADADRLSARLAELKAL